ncbi:MAG: hypothetical protein PHE86_01355 [Candidatus Marinimicrobia bacterium]|nr:hypothetical protein [Candidatus Neomarinimicrobiota bacterium]MDD5582896.1 hypothetical protein [Candidatus Neomarinimicrobiota bacterium]
MKKHHVIFMILLGLLSCAKSSSYDDDLTRFIISGNSRAALEPCGCRIPAGGLPRRVGFIYSMEKGMDEIIKLEAGNWLFPAYNPPETVPESWKEQANLLAEAYKMIDFDAINVGFTDLSLGYEYLNTLKKEYHLPLLSTNLINKEGELIFNPYYVIKQKNLRTAVFGVTHLTDDQALRFPALKPSEAIRKQLPKVRNQVDLILVLADLSVEDTEALGKAIPEIDFIINSRHKAWTQLPKKTEGKAMYTYLGPEGQYLGILDVIFRDPQKPIHDLSAVFHRYDFSKERLEEYRTRAGETPVDVYYQDNPGLLRTLRVYEKEIEKQKTMIDTTQNYMHWTMRLLDNSVYTHPEWEGKVNSFLFAGSDEKK